MARAPTIVERAPGSRPRPAQRGTTLIELMVGLVVLMALTTVALPMVSSLLREHNLRTAADELVHAMDVARSRARSNRIAYGLVVNAGSSGFKATVLHGTSASCGSLTGAGATTVQTIDFTTTNPRGDAPVAIVRQAPVEVANPASFPCFKPDGRVLRADTATPFKAPSGTRFMAGDVYFELQRIYNNIRIGNKLQVQLSYNGTARVTFGYDLGKLQ